MILKKYILFSLTRLLCEIQLPQNYYSYNLICLKNIYNNHNTINYEKFPIIEHQKNLKLNNILKWLNFKKLYLKKNNNLLNFFSIYHLQEYFTSILDYNFCFRATNLMSIIKRYYKLIRRKIRWTKMPWKLQFIYPQDIYSLFFCAFMVKDIFLIQTWIKKQFERKSIKLYKPLIYTIWFLIKIFGWRYRKYNNIKGIFLTFKGKLVKGGSRKKVMSFSFGKLKSSSKKNKFISTSFVLRTISGSVSCRLYLTF